MKALELKSEELAVSSYVSRSIQEDARGKS